RVQAAGSASEGLIDQRFQVLETLGHGGMAVVYRVKDLATGREVALKQLLVSPKDKHYDETTALFEREFHTLAELSHPSIIEVYDYGVSDSRAHYTMELLLGGDLRELSPVPWQRACAVFYDVCSSLALLHSRRLVHRDVSPRNLRFSTDGRAKLIDFGAMVPMGPGSLIVGTPQFVAPEVVYRSTLDARTDLFSLGGTFYFALVGRPPHAVRDFSGLFDAWASKPVAPSRYVEDIPEVLEALVLSLLSVDPAVRPRSAFEVMQRLAGIAGLDRSESIAVSRAYLSTPALVGRDDAIATLRARMSEAFAGKGSAALLRGVAGVGRSRMLDAGSLVAKALGATVARAAASGGQRVRFGAAAALSAQLLQTAPEAARAAAARAGVLATLFVPSPIDDAPGRLELRDLGHPSLDRRATHRALSRWILCLSDERPIAVCIDDVDGVDEASAALIAALATECDGHRLFILCTADDDAKPNDEMAFRSLERQSTPVLLAPLTREGTVTLFESVFGDVPNVRVLSDTLYAVALGNPQSTMALAQHLVDHRVLRYDGGNWTLPARIDDRDVPNSAEDAMRARLTGLSATARWLVEAQSLASHASFSRDDYARLRPDLDSALVDRALRELVTEEVLVSDGRLHALAHRNWSHVLATGMADAARAERHLALASLYRSPTGIAKVHHLLSAGRHSEAIERVLALLSTIVPGDLIESDLPADEVATTLERALDAAQSLGRKLGERYDIEQWIVAVSVGTDERFYFRAAPHWLARLKRDSGYDAWCALDSALEPGERLSQAMQVAYGAYVATPEDDRVCRPDQALKFLVQFVAISLAVGTRSLDLALIESLPSLLEPFAPLSSAVAAIHENAIAAVESICRAQPDRARARWITLRHSLAKEAESDLPHVGLIQRAVATALGSIEAWMGLPSASEWSAGLDDDPLQRVSALHIRRILRLQQGDWEGAERLRKRAEVLALSARVRQMFNNLTMIELGVNMLARDLTGLRQGGDRIEALADRFPGWVPYRHLARGRFLLVQGSLEESLAAFSDALALVAPKAEAPYPLHGAWLGSAAGYVEALVELERFEEARESGERTIGLCETLEVGLPRHEVTRALAIAEAKLGYYQRAAERLDWAIDEQSAVGVAGLYLGATYEARARVAMWAGDDPALEKFAGLAAHEYRQGRNSPLAGRYERLMADARRAGKTTLPSLSEFGSSQLKSSVCDPRLSAKSLIARTMAGADDRRTRCAHALRLLCEAHGVTSGHLYLFEGGRASRAASEGANPPTEPFDDAVRAWLARELAESEVATRLTNEMPELETRSSNEFRDENGNRQSAVLLVVADGTSSSCVGVAVFAKERHAARAAVDSNLLATVGAHLVKSGDAEALRLPD
ncbi:MAG TPA: protein kinase, partial [Polyangiaceae bacterium]|nr:protein kinase [Polyangiaceae bacterium]